MTQPNLLVRRDVWTLPEGDRTLFWYAKAVAQMQSLPPDNALSWTYQAAIHGVAPELPAAQLPLANQCQHFSWFFVAWHRMYVYRFEQIVRHIISEFGGPADWALPYWNYTYDTQRAALPVAFRDSNATEGTPNPLYVAQRAYGINDGVPLNPTRLAPITTLAARGEQQFTSSGVDPGFGGPLVYGFTQFFQQPDGSVSPGALENSPHDSVHVLVGASMDGTLDGPLGWMSAPFTAAQDPIFWLHHANIDRIWDEWSFEGGQPPTDPGWLTQEFELFDTTGQRVSMACADVLNVRRLGYIFDTTDHPLAPPLGAELPTTEPLTPRPEEAPMSCAEPEIVGASTQPITLVGVAASVQVIIDQRSSARFSRSIPAKAVLCIENIELQRNPGIVYAVFVDPHDDASEDDREGRYVGNLSFFGVEAALRPTVDKPAHGVRFAFDISRMIEQLRQQGRWDGHRFTVSFEPVELLFPKGQSPASRNPGSPGPSVEIGRVALYYS